jgi:hypothetical protein
MKGLPVRVARCVGADSTCGLFIAGACGRLTQLPHATPRGVVCVGADGCSAAPYSDGWADEAGEAASHTCKSLQ